MRWLSSIIWVLFISSSLSGQEFPAIDSNYLPEIQSVTLFPTNVVTGYPIADLNGGQLSLRFDDLEGVFNKYTYSFFHCNRYWEYSKGIQEFDFRDGFVEEEIWDYELSIGAEVKYTHFTLNIPDRNKRFLISGNYVLVVYKYVDGEKKVAFTRRFVVVDNKVDIAVEQVMPAKTRLSRTHHELQFHVNFEEVNILNPYQEVRANVYQNGIWERGYLDIPPLSTNGNTMAFNYRNQIVFPAIKEFRYFDIRNLNFRTERVFEIYREQDTVNVVLKTDQPRGDSYFTYFDINGKFVLQNMDGVQRLVNYDNEDDQMTDVLLQAEKEVNRRNQLMSRYAKVHFSLEHSRIPQKDVYIVGGFNNWKLDDSSRMKYDANEKIYYREILLKQGYYEYYYVTKDLLTGETDWTEIEGSRFETINEYLFFVYYRPFGTLYDQLIGVLTYVSNR